MTKMVIISCHKRLCDYTEDVGERASLYVTNRPMNTNVQAKEVMEKSGETKLSLQEFLDEYEFSSEFFRVENRGEEELRSLAMDFLDLYDVKDEDLVQYQEEGNDFRNDQTKDGYYRCDISSEWADGQVDIYYRDLYEKARDYADHIEEWLSEVGYNKERGMIGAMQGGQYLYYSHFAGEILNGLGEYVNREK